MKNLLIAVAIVILIPSWIQAKVVIVGVLEEPQCKSGKDQTVRVLFAKRENAWIALDNKKITKNNVSSIMTWTIAFDGRNLGEIKTFDRNQEINDEWAYRRDKILEIDSQSISPKIKNKGSFEGWCNIPEYRPVVLVSQPSFSDPDLWKPSQPPKVIIDESINMFRSMFKTVDNCESQPPYRAVPYEYKNKDVLNLKSYRSKKNEYLILLHLNPKLDKCDGLVEEQSGWAPTWFNIDNRGGVHNIGEFLDIVDAGDYDNDGKSEVLFWYEGYNEDGYILFYDNFKRKIAFLWQYH